MIFNWKEYSESFKRTFLVILSYGLAFGLGNIALLFNPNIISTYYISEQEKFVSYSINLKDLLDLLFIGPIFTILSFLLLKRILDDLKAQGVPDSKITLCIVIFLIAIVMYNYGNAVHVTMSRLNHQIEEDYGSEQVYYSVYFLDEVFGHIFLGIGFFIIITECCFLHTFNLNQHKDSEDFSEFLMNKHEENWNFLFGLALGIITAIAYAEGQCAFIFLILNPIIGILLLIYSKKKDIKVRINSMVMIFIVMTIAYSITMLLWGVFTGIKTFYPYFYQATELI